LARPDAERAEAGGAPEGAIALTPEAARRLALALPGAVEQDHHGRPSFRVGGKIFATLWDEQHMNVMLDEPGIRTAVGDHPEWCAERLWGKRLAAVAVDLERAPEARLGELLADAWEGKAPSSTRREGSPARRPR
jgi:hypothetical protein